MRWKTREPPGAGDPRGAQTTGADQPQEPSPEEHLGPISFTRERKDDGRMLMLFRRRGERRDG